MNTQRPLKGRTQCISARSSQKFSINTEARANDQRISGVLTWEEERKKRSKEGIQGERGEEREEGKKILHQLLRRQEDHKVKARLGYRVSLRLFCATWGDPVSRKK